MSAILLVEDDANASAVFAQVLTLHGHEIVPVASGEEAIGALKRLTFDLIVVDLFLSGRDGFDVIAYARERLPRAQIVAISGSLEALPAAARLGVSAILAKPFSPGELSATISRVLR